MGKRNRRVELLWATQFTIENLWNSLAAAFRRWGLPRISASEVFAWHPVEPLERRLLFATHYVDAAATGTDSGTSWSNAYTTLTQALTAGGANTIEVAQGTYFPTSGTSRTATFQMINYVAIYGGYEGVAGIPTGNENVRNTTLYPTILSGDIGTIGTYTDDSYNVVTGSSTNSSAVLDGVTVEYGYANGSSHQADGSGVLILSGSPTINNCTFYDNQKGGVIFTQQASSAPTPSITNCDFISNPTEAIELGALTSGDATVSGCTFTDNEGAISAGTAIISNCTFTSDAWGNAPALDMGSAMTVSGCTFTDNTATNGNVGNAGAIFISAGGSGTISDCTFTNNTGANGGAIQNVSDYTVNITGCTFTGNTNTYASWSAGGGAVYDWGTGTTELIDDSFYGNSSREGGGAFQDYGSGTSTFVNCIFSENTADGGSAVNVESSGPTNIINCSITENNANSGGDAISGTVTIENSILWGDGDELASGQTVSYSDIEGGYTGTGNINSDPLFVRTAGTNGSNDYGDLELTQSSPVINAGESSDVPSGVTTDIIGVTRILGSAVDMGAYESAEFFVTPATEPVEAVQNQPFNGVVALFTDPDGGSTTNSYTASINWGDGTITSTNTITTLGNSVFSVSGTHTYLTVGAVTPIVTVSDGTNVSGRQVALDVLGMTPSVQTVNAVQGTAFTAQELTQFTDTAPDAALQTYSASINWGLGSTSAGTVVSNGEGGWIIEGGHTYTATGVNVPIITITASPDGRTTTVSGDVNVSSLNPTSDNASGVQNASSVYILGTFLDSNSGVATSLYSQTVSWGDGTVQTAGVATDGTLGFKVGGGHAYSQPGLYNTTVVVTEPGGATTTIASFVTVTGITINTQEITPVQDTAFSGVVALFTDTAPDATNYYSSSYTAAIQWGDGNTSTGVVASVGDGVYSVSGTNTYSFAGSLTPIITLSTPDYRSSTADGDAEVSGITGTGQTITVAQSALYNGPVADFTDTDPSAPQSASGYTASINWENGTSTAGVISSDGNGGFLVSGTNAYSAAGVYSPIVTLTSTSDSRTGTAAASADVTSLTISPDNISGTQGVTFSSTVASFVDANTGTFVSSYSASIAWGDGNISDGVISSNGSGTFYVSASDDFAEAGQLPFEVTITEPSGATQSADGTASVAGLTAVAQTINVVQDQASSSVVVGLFTDNDPSDSAYTTNSYTASIDWGDGNTSVGTLTSLGSNTYTISASISTATFTQANTYDTTITILATDGLTTSAQGEAQVAGITGSGNNINGNTAIGFDGIIADFTDDAPDAPSYDYMDYSASINWGNDTTSGSVAPDGVGGYTVSGTAPYSDPGLYTPVITLTENSDSRIGTATAEVDMTSMTADIGSISGNQNGTFSGVVANFTDTVTEPAGAYTASISWGDGNVSPGVVTANSSGGFYVTGEDTFAEAGSLAVDVTITEASGATLDVYGTAAVTGLIATGQTISPTTAQGTACAGTVATFTDSTSGTYTATIAWGDGNVSAGTITSIGTNTYAITGTNTYSAAGTFDPTITITDPDGLTTVADGEVDMPGITGTGESISGELSGNVGGELVDFTDTALDASGVAGDYTASINWDDGGSPTSGTLAPDGSGGFTVTGTHSFSFAGTYTPTVTVSYPTDGRSEVITGIGVNVTSVTVTADSLTGTLVQGEAFTGTVASFADSNGGTVPNSYTAVIDWGDGNETEGLIIPKTGGGFNVIGSDVFASAGTLTFTVTVIDPSGATASGSNTAVVEGIAITPETVSVNAGVAVGTATLLATFTNTHSSTDSYTAYVDFGDGNWVSGTATSVGGNTYDITLSSPYTPAMSGTFDPNIDVLDSTSGTNDALSNVPDQTPLPAPTTPTYSVSADGTAVTLSWSYTNTSNLTSFEIEEQDADAGGNYEVVQTITDLSSLSTVLSGLTQGHDYSFFVRAVSIGQSSNSAPVAVNTAGSDAPETPTDFIVTDEDLVSSGNDEFELNWNPVTPPTGDWISYEIEYHQDATDNTTTGSAGWSTIGEEPGDYFFANIGQIFDLRVVAVVTDPYTDVSYFSAPSSQQTAAPSGGQPAAPETPTSAAWSVCPDGNGEPSIEVIWPDDDPIDGDLSVQFVQNGVPTTNAWNLHQFELVDTDGQWIGWIGNSGYDDSSPSVDTSEPFTLEITRWIINDDGQNEVSPVVAISMQAISGTGSPPNAPSNLTAGYANGSDTTVDLEWDDNSANETGFDIMESLDGGTTFTQIGTVGPDADSYVVQLSANTGPGQMGADQTTGTGPVLNGILPIYYKIAPVNAAGTGATTNPVTPLPAIQNLKAYAYLHFKTTLFGDKDVGILNFDPTAITWDQIKDAFKSLVAKGVRNLVSEAAGIATELLNLLLLPSGDVPQVSSMEVRITASADVAVKGVDEYVTITVSGWGWGQNQQPVLVPSQDFLNAIQSCLRQVYSGSPSPVDVIRQALTAAAIDQYNQQHP